MATTTATIDTAILPNNVQIQPDVVRGTWNITTISAAGISQSNATAIGNTAPFVIIDNNTVSNGVLLPTASFKGQEIAIYPNLASGNKVYPPVGGTINSGVLNTPVTATGRKAAQYISVDSTGLNYVTLGL